MFNILNYPTHLIITGSFLATLTAAFVFLFAIPAAVYLKNLQAIRARIDSLDNNAGPEDFESLFSSDSRLKHLWAEFRETLHTQKEERDGQVKILAIRSTVSADAYFNSQAMVESRLHTEFFKHLPGIFTGLGIIGTFGGLIEGLRKFQVSENAATVRASLESLMGLVGEAFIISAAAISVAMAVTFLEKLLLAALYNQSEAITHGIDKRFESGAGEEYLARLVNASEDSASQSKILKDALVRELGDILREISSLQMQAAGQQNEALGATIAASIEHSLQGPLSEIAGAVKQASSDQSSSAVQMLNDVMVSFSQRLNDLFGGQINGINEANRQSAQSMQEAVSALNALIGKLEASSKQATDDMATTMMASVKAMEERQSSINSQTQEFVDQIRTLVENSQDTTQKKVQGALDAIGAQMGAILSELGDSQRSVLEENREREKEMASRAADMVSGLVDRMSQSLQAMDERQASILQQLGDSQGRAEEANREREREMAERASGLVNEMSESVHVAVKEMAEASRNMAESVARLSNVTAASVDKMNAGAERLGSAAASFAQAGDRVTGVITQVERVGTKLSELTGQLATSAGSLQDVLRDYQAQRQAVANLMTEVRGVIEAARKDASITADIVARIELSASKLAAAQKSADDYLSGVNTVLAASTEAFRSSVVSTLSQVNQEFHSKLSQAVGLLASAVAELETSLGSYAPQDR